MIPMAFSCKWDFVVPGCNLLRPLGRICVEGSAEYWSGSCVTGEVPVTQVESDLRECEIRSLKYQRSLVTANVEDTCGTGYF